MQFHINGITPVTGLGIVSKLSEAFPYLTRRHYMKRKTEVGRATLNFRKITIINKENIFSIIRKSYIFYIMQVLRIAHFNT